MTAEIRTLCDVFLSAAASGKPDLLTSKVGGRWTPISAGDFGYTVRALSLGLNALGVQPGERVAIVSENRPEWAMADYAILCAGAWTVPIYPTLPAAQIARLARAEDPFDRVDDVGLARAVGTDNRCHAALEPNFGGAGKRLEAQ